MRGSMGWASMWPQHVSVCWKERAPVNGVRTRFSVAPSARHDVFPQENFLSRSWSETSSQEGEGGEDEATPCASMRRTCHLFKMAPLRPAINQRQNGGCLLLRCQAHAWLRPGGSGPSDFRRQRAAATRSRAAAQHVLSDGLLVVTSCAMAPLETTPWARVCWSPCRGGCGA